MAAVTAAELQFGIYSMSVVWLFGALSISFRVYMCKNVCLCCSNKLLKASKRLAVGCPNTAAAAAAYDWCWRSSPSGNWAHIYGTRGTRNKLGHVFILIQYLQKKTKHRDLSPARIECHHTGNSLIYSTLLASDKYVFTVLYFLICSPPLSHFSRHDR